MIGAIIFSRDRACQLDLLLWSLSRNAPGLFEKVVIVHASNNDFRDGYEQCVRDHESEEVAFIPENGITYQVRSLVRRFKAVTFLTDDSVLYREIALEPILTLSRRDVLTFSLRLGRNTTICYPLNQKQVAPESPEGDLMLWRWRGAQGDFSYPMSLDGHIFRSEDILPLIENRNFSTPNHLEEMLMGHVKQIGKPLMASYPHSALVGIPANRVQDHHPNRTADSHSPEELNEKYLRGMRIDLDALDFSDIRGAHQEVDLVLS